MCTLRQAGLDRSRHKDAVTENDMRKMYSSGVLGIDIQWPCNTNGTLKLPFILAGVAGRGYVSSPRTVSVRKWTWMAGLTLLWALMNCKRIMKVWGRGMKLRKHECMKRVGKIVRQKASEPTCQYYMEVVKLFSKGQIGTSRKLGFGMWDVLMAKTVVPNSWKSSQRKQGCRGSTPTIASE